MTKPTKWLCVQSDQSSLSAWRKLGSLATHWAHSEDSDQTGGMPRLIWVFAWRTATLLVLSCRGSVMFNPTLLFHKTRAVCSLCTPSTFLHTWLIRPPLTIVPMGVSLQVLRYGKLCWLSACVSMFCGFTFYQIYSFCLKATMYVADADVHVVCRSYFGRGFVWWVIRMYYKQYDAKSAQMSGDRLFSLTYWLWSMYLALPQHRYNYFQFLFMIQNGKWFSNAECVVCVEVLRPSQQLR